MSKQRKSVTLDPEVAAYLEQEGRNASQTVNRLVKLDMGEEAVNEEILRMRMDMEKDQYKDAASKARGHLERYNQLKTRLEEVQQSNTHADDEDIDRAVKVLTPSSWYDSLPKEKQIPGPDSDKLQSVAEELDIEPDALYTAVRDRVMED